MRNDAVKFPLVGIFLLGSVHVGLSMDLIVCEVDNESKVAQTDYSRELCKTAAEAANARHITASEMNIILQSPSSTEDTTRLHVIEAKLPSSHEIAFNYAFGTATEWRTHQEKRFNDLHIDIMDAELNDATIRMFADTIRRLSR